MDPRGPTPDLATSTPLDEHLLTDWHDGGSPLGFSFRGMIRWCIAHLLAICLSAGSHRQLSNPRRSTHDRSTETARAEHEVFRYTSLDADRVQQLLATTDWRTDPALRNTRLERRRARWRRGTGAGCEPFEPTRRGDRRAIAAARFTDAAHGDHAHSNEREKRHVEEQEGDEQLDEGRAAAASRRRRWE